MKSRQLPLPDVAGRSNRGLLTTDMLEAEDAAGGVLAAGALRIVMRHVRSGGLYEVMGPAKLEATGQELTIYRSMKDGQVWARPTGEFRDGRFVLEYTNEGSAPPEHVVVQRLENRSRNAPTS